LLAGIVRNLVVIAADGGHEAKLVGRRLVEDEGRETADACGLVMQNLRAGGLEAEVGAVAGKASVVGEAICVVAKADLVVGVVVAAVAEDDFGLTVSLEAGAGNDVENSVGAVAIFGGVSTALDFEIVDVLGIELRADVGGDVGVWNGNAIEQPGDLVASAN